MNEKPESLNGKEVICMIQHLIQHDTFKSNQLLEKLKLLLCNKGEQAIPPGSLNKWLGEGINCEILTPNQNWRQGKLRIKLELEFIPDEIGFPLEDVRQGNNNHES